MINRDFKKNYIYIYISVSHRSTPLTTVIQAVHSQRYIVAKCHFFSVDHVKRGAFTASGSGVEPGLHSPCQCERTARGINYANIEVVIVDGGFGSHAKVK